MWNRTEDKIKVKITWIRHGMTQANGEHRYLGKTDEPLSETGIRLLQEKKKEYFSSPPEFLYTSPMKRCVQTAELLFERKVKDFSCATRDRIIQDLFPVLYDQDQMIIE